VIAVGSDGPDKHELDVDLLARADRIVADSLPSACSWVRFITQSKRE